MRQSRQSRQSRSIKWSVIVAVGIVITLGVFVSKVFGQGEKVYKLEISSSELTILGKALENMPYKDVAGLLVKLQSQVQSQQTKSQQPSQEKK